MSKPKSTIVAAILATLLCIAWGCSLGFEDDTMTQWVRPSDPSFVLTLDLLCAWLIVFVIARSLLRLGAHAGKDADGPGRHSRQRPHGSAAENSHRLFPASWNAASILESALLVFIAWLPVLLFTWPGSSSPDTINMLYQYASPAPTSYWTLRTVVDAEFINHHPVLDSLICGMFWDLGGLVGDHTWGFFFFALANFAFAAAVSGALVCYIASRLSAPRGLVIGTQLFLMFYPAFPLYFSYMSKDAIFVPWFMLWCLVFIDQWRKGKSPSGGSAALFVVASVLCVLTKQLALYIIAPGIIALFFHLRTAKARSIVSAELVASLVLALAVFPAVVYPLVGGVAPGGKQEILGTPLNQAVTLYEEQPSAFSRGEIKTLGKVVDLDRIERRWEMTNKFRVDRVKDNFRPNATDEDIEAFLELWVKKGIGYPGSYLYTTYQICMPFFMPTQGISAPTFVDEKYIDRRKAQIERQGLVWTDLDLQVPQSFHENQWLVRASVETATQVPGLGIFFAFGFYSGWLPIICLAALVMRRRRALWALTPLGVFWLLQLVDPAALTRYALPLIVLAPLYLSWTIRSIRANPADFPQHPTDSV